MDTAQQSLNNLLNELTISEYPEEVYSKEGAEPKLLKCPACGEILEEEIEKFGKLKVVLRGYCRNCEEYVEINE